LWMDRLESEHDNLRGALSWLFVQDPISGLRLGAAIGHFWHVRAHHSEGRAWLAKFLETTDSDRCSIVVRAKALNTLSMLTWFQGEYHAALALQEEGLTLWQEAGEQGDGLAMGNRNLAMAQWFTGDLPAAQVTIAESVKLFKKTGNEAWADDALFFQGFFARTIGDLDFAQTKAYENLRLARKVGDIMGLAGGYSLLGHIAYDQSNFDSARVNYEKSLAYFCEVGDLFGMSFLLSSLSDVYHVKGDYDSEENNWQEYLEIARKIGNKLQIAYALSRLGLVSMLLNENEQARKCFAQCLDICSELEERRHEATAECLSGMVLWLLNKEKPAQAAQLLGFVQQFLTGEGDLEDIFLSVHDRVLAEVKRQLEEEIFISSTAAGKALTVEQAIDYAAAIIQASALFLVD
ncbi:MAG: tetratricopeptide repeat protein, partial [Candidatus Promineifilaceae bacterium]|nr:tetratricopeptide repeat protein [Candidatus Promineifilaceae bacterium]